MTGGEADADPASVLSLLSEKIEDLPQGKFIDVVERLDQIASLPAAASVLARARQRIKQERVSRPLKLQRIACEPFEDLLVASDGGARSDRIPRAMLGWFWTTVCAANGPAIADLERSLRATERTDRTALRQIAAKVWALAAESMAATLGTGEPTDPIGEARRALLRDTLLLGEAIQDFKAAVPENPLEALDEAVTTQIVRRLRAVTEAALPAHSFIVAIAARLANPGELMTLLARTERAQSGLSRDGAAGVDAALGAVALGEIEARVTHLDRDPRAGGMPANPEEIAKDIDQLAALLRTVQEASRGELRGVLAERAKAVSQTIRGVLTKEILEPAEAAIAAALDPQGDGPASPDTIRQSEAHARALRASRRAASTVGLGDKAAAAVALVRARCAAEAEGLSKRLALDAGVDATRQREIQIQLYQAIRLVELLSGSQEALELMTECRKAAQGGL